MKYFLLLTLIFSVSEMASAQIATSPDGIASNAPAVGKNRRSLCSGQSCFEIKIQPYCFGTNLRAYSSDIQLSPTEPVKIEMTIQGESTTDKVEVEFPASLTYNTGTIRPVCTAVSGSGSHKIVKCRVSHNGVIKELQYQTSRWRLDKNPTCYANGGSHGQEYCDYASMPLEFTRISGDLDTNLTCFYTFDNSWQIKNDVICNFPSLIQDQTDNVTVKINNSTATNMSLSALVNSIETKLNISSLPSINSNVEYKNGRLAMPKSGSNLPNVTVQYSQGGRMLEKSGYQIPDKVQRFESSNGNMSYTIIARFPGQQGFCGGYYSPLMLFFGQSLPQFNGISSFPLHGVKDGGRVNWPEAGNKGYFLARLKEGEKEIKTASQLFGQDGVHENGFESLIKLDSNKDGKIDSKDKAWKELVLWNDANGNGISESSEIVSLSKMKVRSIDLDYKTSRRMKFDNRAMVRESSQFSYVKNGKVVKADILDVWFTPID